MNQDDESGVKLDKEVLEQLHGSKIDLETYLLMEYTANFVRKEGDNFEFRLKILPEASQLPFLEPTHHLHGCFTIAILRKSQLPFTSCISRPLEHLNDHLTNELPICLSASSRTFQTQLL